MEGVNVRLLDHCQLSSLLHYCGFKEQEIPGIYTAGMVINWNSNVNILIFWDTDFWLSWAVSSNHKIKTKKLLKCFTLHAMNLKYMKVSLFEITYKKKWTFSRHSNLLRCTCIFMYIYTHIHIYTYCPYYIIFLLKLLIVVCILGFALSNLEKKNITFTFPIPSEAKSSNPSFCLGQMVNNRIISCHAPEFKSIQPIWSSFIYNQIQNEPE